jgi:molybdate transport system substrate-binding protein
MRSFSAAVFLTAWLVLPPQAMALDVICPPMVREGVTQLAASFTKQMGIPVTVKAPVMGKIMDEIKAGPTDVILLPSSAMEALAKDRGLDARQALGRMEIALAVRPGAPHPDISTVEKFAAAVKSAKTVAYTQPGPPRGSMEAAIIDQILHRPEFTGAHLLTTTTGSGVDALAKGDADMALQVTSAFISRKDVELVGPLPSGLAAHIDVDIAVAQNAADARAASDFVRYVTRPEAMQEWNKFGLAR